MTKKRFRVFKIDEMYGVSDDKAEYTVAWDNSKLIMDNLCDLLNELNDENERLLKANMELTEENTAILNTIRTAYQNERTSLGRNTLKQLIEALE